jgi:O-6-methylguanine DNA methyltransferase
MTSRHGSRVQQFATATDALLAGQSALDEPALAPELGLVRRLRRSAAPAPDPAFVQGLREELRARAAGRHGAATSLRYATLETPYGLLAIAHRDGRVLACAAVARAGAAGPYPASEAEFERRVASTLGAWPQRDPDLPPKLMHGVLEHLEGRRRFTAIDLSWLPPFQRRVLEKTAEIPRGEVRPYGWVAREIGAPGATRAVGTALGHNPIPFIIPCHRVVRSDGTLGEYSGGGPAVKERVLTAEGTPLAEIQAGLRRGERFRACRSTHTVCYPSCHAARRMPPETVVPFATLAEAQARGYHPCTACRPA